MNRLMNRGSTGQVAVAVAGQLEPVDPAYTKPNMSSRPWDQNAPPSEPVSWKAPIVYRGQRRNGQRYLHALGAVHQPISPLGTGPDIAIATWNSEFQPEEVQRHDWGFNDALFEAGYPGFNLGLSFKVPVLPQQVTGPGSNMRMRSSNVRVTLTRMYRATGKASPNG